MNLHKIVKKHGNSLVITFDTEDRIIYGIDEGDRVDINDMVVIKKRRGKKDGKLEEKHK